MKGRERGVRGNRNGNVCLELHHTVSQTFEVDEVSVSINIRVHNLAQYRRATTEQMQMQLRGSTTKNISVEFVIILK